jgi:hypothetical protein
MRTAIRSSLGDRFPSHRSTLLCARFGGGMVDILLAL